MNKLYKIKACVKWRQLPFGEFAEYSFTDQDGNDVFDKNLFQIDFADQEGLPVLSVDLASLRELYDKLPKYLVAKSPKDIPEEYKGFEIIILNDELDVDDDNLGRLSDCSCVGNVDYDENYWNFLVALSKLLPKNVILYYEIDGQDQILHAYEDYECCFMDENVPSDCNYILLNISVGFGELEFSSLNATVSYDGDELIIDNGQQRYLIEVGDLGIDSIVGFQDEIALELMLRLPENILLFSNFSLFPYDCV